MAYKALYRQWRPQDFSHVVGQEAIITSLRNQVITGRIAHAYLFCGSRGTGKTSTAKILSKAINCTDPQNGDPCGLCENCRRQENEGSLDIIEIDAASNNGVDEMRNLRDTVKYPPQNGRYKVYIIDEVHMLSSSAFNALLKTLEEPPSHVVFILATTEPQKLPATILSRCQRYDFGRIPAELIRNRLQEAADQAGVHTTGEALMIIARSAEGGMRDALSILDKCISTGKEIDGDHVRMILGISDSGFMFRFADALNDNRISELYRMIGELYTQGKDLSVFCKDICRHFRSLIIAKTCMEDQATIMDQTEEDLEAFRSQSTRFQLSRMLRIIDLYMVLDGEMRYAFSPRIALENTTLKCCLKTEDTDPTTVNDRLSELEKQVETIRHSRAYQPGDPGKTPENIAVLAEGRKDLLPGENMNKPARSLSGHSSAPAAGLTSDREIWDKAVERIKKEDPAVAVMLTQGGRYLRREGNLYVWVANDTTGAAVFVNSLNSEKKKKVVSDALSGAAGEVCSFSAVMNNAQGTPDGTGQQFVETLYQTFGKENVRTVEEIDES